METEIHSGIGFFYGGSADQYFGVQHNRTCIAAHTVCRLSAAAYVRSDDNWGKDAEEQYFLTGKTRTLKE